MGTSCRRTRAINHIHRATADSVRPVSLKKFKTMNLYKFLTVFMLLAMAGVQAQEKRMLKPEDYALWKEFGNAGISSDARWVYYSIKNTQGDSLFLRDTKSKLQYSFAGVRSTLFDPKNRWFGYIKKDSLNVLDPSNGTHRFIAAGTIGYDYSSDGHYLVANVAEGENKSLKIIDLKSFRTTSIANVQEYRLSPDKRKIAFVTDYHAVSSASILDFSSLKTLKAVSGKAAVFKGLQWDATGRKLAFYALSETEEMQNSQCSIYSIAGIGGKLAVRHFDGSQLSLPPQAYIVPTKLYVSAKTDRIFFDVMNAAAPFEEFGSGNPQVWLSEDRTLPPADSREKKRDAVKWTSWNTETGAVMEVEDDTYGHAVLTGDEKNVLLYDAMELEPAHKNGGLKLALYVKNLDSGIRHLACSGVEASFGEASVSPAGNYISYFKDSQWWVHDIRKRTNTCVTENMPLPLDRGDYDRPTSAQPLGNPAWTAGDRELVIYDRSDIWLVKPDGSSRKRLTDGAGSSRIYRLYQKVKGPFPRDSYSGFVSGQADFSKPVLLHSKNAGVPGEGLAVLQPNGKIRNLFQAESRASVISKTENELAGLFMENSFEIPWRLFATDEKGREVFSVDSNPQQRDFYWGKSSVIEYKGTAGAKLQGALFYPANYDPSKSYPMLVHIYERKVQEKLNYIPPSESSFYGFNPTNYINDGYFVLCPDIAYGVNTTGEDAVSCVTAAVEKATESASIDPKSIGLIGHSFGGYEAAYIMGRSRLFKTAIIGAPMVDLESAYLTLDGHGQSNMWRFEDGQVRITAPFYSSEFKDNEVLGRAKDYASPVLIWTGTADKQLDWKHSMKLQSALWKLGKKSTMLVYPEEEHVLMDKKNQLDLSQKVRDWLEFYLRDGKRKEWMGMQ